jgi:hypothetical protein
VTQLQRRVVPVKGFGYLVKDYLGLVVCYTVLVRVSDGSFVLVRSFLRETLYLLKNLCWVFSHTRVSQDKSCVTVDVFFQ